MKTCPNHPEREQKALGLCGTCYARKRRAEDPQFNRDALAATLRYAAKPGNKERRDIWRRAWTKRTRLQVLQHYSDSEKPFCKCCGESHLEFMSIDHIHGGGLKHRREIKSQIGLYRWLITEGFPSGFRVLCHNCNLARGFYGYCPHEKE